MALGLAFCMGGCTTGNPNGDNPNTGGTETPGNPDDGKTETPENPDENEGDEETVKNIAWYVNNGYSTLFKDPYMKNGLAVKKIDGSEGFNLNFDFSTATPSWTMAQWHSKFDLGDYQSLRYEEGGNQVECTSKGETVNGAVKPAKIIEINSQKGSIYMELNAQVEYDAPRENGEGWPHTLLSQDFSGNLVHVSELSELVMGMDYTVTMYEDCMGSTANTNLHCSQLVWYITLQNRTKGSVGYGQYIWFGLNLWDNRMSGGVCPEYAAQDLGKEDATKAFIYQPSSEHFFAEKRMPTVGELRSMHFDVLSTAKSAFELAKQRGYLPDTAWEDIYIGSMNFGLEVTGTYNTGVKFDTVGVYYKYLGEE